MTYENCEIRLINSPEQCDWRRYGVFIVNFVFIVEFDQAKVYDCKKLLRKNEANK